METILTATSLIHSYQQHHQHLGILKASRPQSSIVRTWHIEPNWQLLITTVGGTNPKMRWQGIAYIGKNKAGHTIFVGCQSTTIKHPQLAQATIIQEAAFQANNMGYQNLVLFTRSTEIKQVWKGKYQPN